MKDGGCNALKLTDYDEKTIKDHIEQVGAGADELLEIEIRQQIMAQILCW